MRKSFNFKGRKLAAKKLQILSFSLLSLSLPLSVSLFLLSLYLLLSPPLSSAVDKKQDFPPLLVTAGGQKEGALTVSFTCLLVSGSFIGNLDFWKRKVDFNQSSFSIIISAKLFKKSLNVLLQAWISGVFVTCCGWTHVLTWTCVQLVIWEILPMSSGCDWLSVIYRLARNGRTWSLAASKVTTSLCCCYMLTRGARRCKNRTCSSTLITSTGFVTTVRTQVTIIQLTVKGLTKLLLTSWLTHDPWCSVVWLCHNWPCPSAPCWPGREQSISSDARTESSTESYSCCLISHSQHESLLRQDSIICTSAALHASVCSLKYTGKSPVESSFYMQTTTEEFFIKVDKRESKKTPTMIERNHIRFYIFDSVQFSIWTMKYKTS